MNKAIEHALALLNSSKLSISSKIILKNTELTLTNYYFGFKVFATDRIKAKHYGSYKNTCKMAKK